jgi:hypothetical protein
MLFNIKILKSLIMKDIYRSLVLIIAFLFLFSCRLDDGIPEMPSTPSLVNYLKPSDIPSIMQKIEKKIGLKSGGNYGANSEASSSVGPIALDQILQVLDTLGNANYTFKVDDEDENLFTFTNLIVRESSGGFVQAPYLLHYRLDSTQISEFLAHDQSMNYFKGIVTQQYLGQNINWNTGLSASPDVEFEDDDLSPCPPTTYEIKGGGGLNDGSDPGDSGPGDVDISDNNTGLGATSGCYIEITFHPCPNQIRINDPNPQEHGPDTCGDPGNRGPGTSYSYAWVCYENAATGINDEDPCSEPSGDVGVLTNDLLDLSLAEQNFWREKIKQAIAEGLTSVAEVAHELYVYCDALVKASPKFTDKVNSLLSLAKEVVEEVTNQNRSTMGWSDLVSIWLFELGNYTDDTINFVDGDATINDLKGQEGVINAIDKAMTEIESGNLDQQTFYQWIYSQDQFYQGVMESNYATSFLGTYTVVIDKVDLGKNVRLDFKVINTSGWESGTRLRRDSDGNHLGIIQNKSRGTGILLGGNLTQTYQWSQIRSKN